MTAPSIQHETQQDDPQLRLRYYRETGQTEEAQHYEQYLRETGQLGASPHAAAPPPTPPSAPRDQTSAASPLPHDTPHGVSREFDDGLAKRGPVSDLSRAALSGATFNFGDELTAGANTALEHGRALLTGQPARSSYAERVAAERAAGKDFARTHPKTNVAAEMAGGLATIPFTMGAGAAAKGATVLGKVGHAAKVGALSGAAYGVGEGEGAGDRLTKGAVGGVLGGVLGGTMSGVGQAATGVARATIPAVARRMATKDATRLLAERVAMDEAAGVPAKTLPAAFPGRALDVGGPNVRSLAQGIAAQPGTGRAMLETALTERAAGERPAIAKALESATGPSSVGMTVLKKMEEARSQEAGRLFGAARQATEGQAIESPTLTNVIKTPAGQAAYKWALTQKANRLLSLPQGAVDPAAPAGFTAEQWANALQRMEAKGMTVPRETIELPDAEVVHYMKQHLAKLARLGQQDGAQGALATSAQGVMGLWGRVQKELPAPWAEADKAFAVASRKIDAFNAGRRILQTTENPAGPARSAPARSLSGVLGTFGTGETAEPLRQGAQHAVSEGFERTSASPQRFFAGSPERVQQVGAAFPNREGAASFQDVVRAYGDARTLKDQLVGNSQTAMRGLEAARRETAPPGVISNLLHGNLGAAGHAIVGTVEKGTRQKVRNDVDAAIAQMLLRSGNTAEAAGLSSVQSAAAQQARRAALLRTLQGRVAGQIGAGPGR